MGAPLEWNGMCVWQRRVTRTSLQWLWQVLAGRPVSAHIRICRVDAAGGWSASGGPIPIAAAGHRSTLGSRR